MRESATTATGPTAGAGPASVAVRAMSGYVARLLPRIEVTDHDFGSRHRVLRVVLWAHLVLVVVLTLSHSSDNAWMLWAFIGAAFVCAVFVSLSSPRRSTLSWWRSVW